MYKWTHRQAWCCLVGSTLATLLASIGSYSLWTSYRSGRLADSRYAVSSIIQTGPEREILKTSLLAEILGLSSDRPISLYAIDPKAAQKTLLACPFIASAHVERRPPSTLYIDYAVRKPIAAVADYENIGIDREKRLFPLAPFTAPKKLAEIYAGLPPFGLDKGGSFVEPLQDKCLDLALEVLQAFNETPWKGGIRVKRIDTSNAYSPHYGQREIILFTEEELFLPASGQPVLCLFPKILRLPVKDYGRQLANFFSLRKAMVEDYRRQIAKARYSQEELRFDARIIDLRIPQTALVQK